MDKDKKEANSKNSFIGVGVQQPSSAFYFFTENINEKT